MVNFNNDITYTKPSNDVNKMIIIESNHYVLDAIEKYHAERFQGQQPTILPVLKARIIRLFEAIKQEFLDHAGKEDKEKVKQILNADDDFNYTIDVWKNRDEKEFLKLHNILSKFLHEKRITEVVNPRDYDAMDPIEEDEAKEI